MVDTFIHIDVDSNKQLQQAIDSALKNVKDLTIPYKLMAQSWFKGNQSIFDRGRQSSGKYIDLSEAYKIRKRKIHGFIYPILLAKGKLARSVTDPRDENAINYIVDKKYLFLGTRAVTSKGFPYAIAIQTGTRKMPARPFVLIGAEQVANKVQNKRLEAWIETINSFVFQEMARLGQVR